MTPSSVPEAQAESRGADRSADEISVLSLINTILRYRWLIFLAAIVGMLWSLNRTYTPSRSYTATTSFLLGSRSASPQAASFASQLGIAVPGTQAGQSPRFYIELLKSRQILGPLVEREFTWTTPTGTVTRKLADLLVAPEGSPQLRRALAVRALAGMVNASEAQAMGTVVVDVTTDNPDLSAKIAAALLDQLNTFNIETRHGHATAERRFTEARLDQVASDLRVAEDRLQSFLQENREFSRSPRLVFDEDRLRRQVEMRQQLYTGLAQAYEQMKIEEIRDTPAITVVEPAEPPIYPNPRGLTRAAVFGLAIGAVFGLAVAFVRSYMVGVGGRFATDAAEFAALRKEMLADIRAPWRPLGRLGQRRSRA